MTTAKTPIAKGPFRLPDPPSIPTTSMTSFKQLAATGHRPSSWPGILGDPETTLVAASGRVVRPTQSMAVSHYPDLLVAFA